MYSKTLKAIARLTRIDLASATQFGRHNPILDSEMHIEEELINLKESLDTYYAAGDTIHKYPKMYDYVNRERRDITKHCLGLLIRMAEGRRMPRPYTEADFEDALKRFVRLVVGEAHRAGRTLPEDLLAIFRPYLTIRQQVALRGFSAGLLWQASRVPQVLAVAGHVPAAVSMAASQLTLRWSK